MPDQESWDLIEYEVNAPSELDGTKVEDKLISFARASGGVRTMTRPLLGIGTMVHFLGPAPKIYKSRILLNTTTFACLEEKTDNWVNIDGTVGTVSVTPKNLTDVSDVRASVTYENVYATLENVGDAYTGMGQHSRVIEYKFERIAPYGF